MAEEAWTPGPTSRALVARARAVTPGGVNSPVRAFQAVGGLPLVMAAGRGPWLHDVDGRDYLDFVCSWGPLILGHAYPPVVAAITRAAALGTSFGTPSAGEVELAEEIVRRVSGVARVRLVSSGTEATMTALRVARAATGRSLVVKFAGCYHGHVDPLLAAAGSGLATLGVPDSCGVSGAVAAETLVLDYNDLAGVRAAFAAHPGRIAAVITEAAAANMGVVAPEPGFNAGLAQIAHANGALLILDEVLTGFRVSPSGWSGIEPVAADLFTFGKVMGGGLPIAAVGGRAELMELLAPAGPVYQAGTLAGNPLACAAGLTTLRCATAEVYAALDSRAEAVVATVSGALRAAGVEHWVGRAGNLFSFFFTPGPVRDFRGAQAQDTLAYAAFARSLYASGVYPPPSAFEAWFVCAAHSDAALERLAAAAPRAATAAAAARDARGAAPPGAPDLGADRRPVPGAALS